MIGTSPGARTGGGPPPPAAPQLRARRPRRPRARALAAYAALVALPALGLGACANTLQDERLQPSFLEPLIAQDKYPVYWLGGTFRGLAIISVAEDPGGAYTLKYGNCREGGENVCVTPLEIVTSPDNSFLPGATTAQSIAVRGVPALAAQDGRTIAVATGTVVVDVYADSAALARAATATMVTINAVAMPGAPLPRARPDSGFASRPLRSQQPPLAPPEPTTLAG